MKKIELVCVSTDNGVYISRNSDGKSYVTHDSVIAGLRFDGEEPQKTYRGDWWLIPFMTHDTTERVLPTKINERYELKEFVPASAELPPILNLVPAYEDPHDDDDTTTFPPEHIERRELYEYKYDMSEVTYEPVEVSYTVLAHMENFEIVKIDHKLHHRLIDEIMVHPILLPTKPCKLSSVESYEIIRKYIKQNIDLNVAKITSDYDFCLTVTKLIELDEPEGYQVDLNNDVFGQKRKRKPNIVTRYRKTRQMEIFKAAPNRPRDGVYKGYPQCVTFEGDSYDDMVAKMKKYLEDLMAEINRPLCDCPHCNGMGVI